MTLTTQTWRVSPEYAIAMAGSAATCAELIAAIKAMFDAEDAIGNNHWSYTYNTTYSIEVKRKGSPTGALAGFRALLFGGTTPSSAATLSGDGTYSSRLYVGTTLSGGSSGPDNDFTSAAPYSSHYLRGMMALYEGNITVAGNFTVSLLESDEICIIVIRGNSDIVVLAMGAIVANANKDRMWGFATQSASSGGVMSASTVEANYSSSMFVMTLAIPYGVYTSSCLVQSEAYVASYAWRYLIPISVYGGQAWEYQLDNTKIALVPVQLLGSTSRGGTTTNCRYLGTLRQLKSGPADSGKRMLVKPDASVRGYFINCKSSTIGMGIYADNEA